MQKILYVHQESNPLLHTSSGSSTSCLLGIFLMTPNCQLLAPGTIRFIVSNLTMHYLSNIFTYPLPQTLTDEPFIRMRTPNLNFSGQVPFDTTNWSNRLSEKPLLHLSWAQTQSFNPFLLFANNCRKTLQEMNYLRSLHLRSNQPQLLVMHRLEVSHDLSHTHRSAGLDQWVEQACGHQFVSHFDRFNISEGIKPITHNIQWQSTRPLDRA